jgi:predicted ester cyclase
MKSFIGGRLFLSGSVLLVAIVFLVGCQQPIDYSKEYKPIADKLVNAWNGINIDSLDSVFDPSFVRTVNQMPDVYGVEGFKKAIHDFRTAYPDLKLTVDNEVYSENAIAVRWVLTGTNTGPGQMPPTGKPINIWGEAILRLVNGKLTKEIVAYNNQAILEQLGFTMMPPKAGKK